MAVGDRNLGGPGRIARLGEIRDHGTITHAARAMKMSYKGARDAIEGMNHLAGEPLVERAAGGRGGGIAAIITNDSAASLGLAEGLAASAIFKASSVIVGVPA